MFSKYNSCHLRDGCVDPYLCIQIKDCSIRLQLQVIQLITFSWNRPLSRGGHFIPRDYKSSTNSLAVRMRLAVQIQSFFNLSEQNGGRVTKVYNNTCTCIFIMVMQRHNCYFKAYKLYYMQLKMIVDDGDMYCFKFKVVVHFLRFFVYPPFSRPNEWKLDSNPMVSHRPPS